MTGGEVGALEGQKLLYSSAPLELTNGALGSREGGWVFSPEQGPSPLGIVWAYSELIWLPENQRLPFSRV